MYSDICTAIMHHSEADIVDEDSIKIVMHPDCLATLRKEMGSDTNILVANPHNGAYRFGDYPIEENFDVDGWKVVNSLSQ